MRTQPLSHSATQPPSASSSFSFFFEPVVTQSSPSSSQQGFKKQINSEIRRFINNEIPVTKKSVAMSIAKFQSSLDSLAQPELMELLTDYCQELKQHSTFPKTSNTENEHAKYLKFLISHLANLIIKMHDLKVRAASAEDLEDPYLFGIKENKESADDVFDAEKIKPFLFMAEVESALEENKVDGKRLNDMLKNLSPACLDNMLTDFRSVCSRLKAENAVANKEKISLLDGIAVLIIHALDNILGENQGNILAQCRRKIISIAMDFAKKGYVEKCLDGLTHEEITYSNLPSSHARTMYRKIYPSKLSSEQELAAKVKEVEALLQPLSTQAKIHLLKHDIYARLEESGLLSKRPEIKTVEVYRFRRALCDSLAHSLSREVKNSCEYIAIFFMAEEIFFNNCGNFTNNLYPTSDVAPKTPAEKQADKVLKDYFLNEKLSGLLQGLDKSQLELVISNLGKLSAYLKSKFTSGVKPTPDQKQELTEQAIFLSACKKQVEAACAEIQEVVLEHVSYPSLSL